MIERRFPPPWRTEQIPGGYVVRDANDQAIAYVYSRSDESEARQALSSSRSCALKNPGRIMPANGILFLPRQALFRLLSESGYMCPMTDISCVICAYMEAPRISAVLSAVAGHPLLKEIIVVDDGSTDATAAVVSRFPSITLLRQVENQGKSRALAAGLRAASGELILYLDADLKHLTPADISALAEPVLSGEADMSISIRKNSLLIYRAIGLDFVSGERLIPRSLLAAHFEEMEKLPPFGIESFMNGRIIGEKLRIRIVRLENVTNTRKSEKMGAWRGTLADWKMALDVLRVISPVEMIRQNYAMLALSRSARQGSR